MLEVRVVAELLEQLGVAGHPRSEGVDDHIAGLARLGAEVAGGLEHQTFFWLRGVTPFRYDTDSSLLVQS